MSALLLWIMLAGAAPAPASPVGEYRLRDGHEAASELVLKPDGSFEYALAYGALDEEASGRWRVVGKQVRLTTRPRPVPPVFSAGAARRSGAAPLIVHVTSPDGRGLPGIDLRVEFESGPPIADYTHSDEGWSMDAAERRRPVAVTLSVPIYGLVSQRFAIDAASANERSFVLTPHDMGRVDFENTALDVAPGKLVMHRGSSLLDYVREAK